MEQLQKKLQESTRDALTKISLKSEDLRRRIAEEREGRIEREERIVEVMEVTETAVEGGTANKKKVKRVGKEKALGGRFTGKTFLRKMAKTLSRSDMERIQRTLWLLLDEKMDATIDEEREREDLELDAQELANTPVDSPSHSCG